MNLNQKQFNNRISVLIVISIFIIVAVSLIPAIKQDLSYHLFIDQRSFFGISNFLNVASNLPFLIIGLLGVVFIIKNKSTRILQEIHLHYLVFFIGVILVAVGSAYYHLNPTNQTLIWDRLPMTIAFMAFFSIILSEFVNVKLGQLVLLPLLIIGLFSIWYWNYTELNEVGDLRLYVLVQFLPIILIPLILLLFKTQYSHLGYFWYFLLMYILAKLTETFDSEIYEFLVVFSGHSIKHVLASIGCFIFYVQLKKRHLLDDK